MIDFYLYRAPPNVGGLHEWEEDHAEPLGSADEVIETISALFPDLEWTGNEDGDLVGDSPSDGLHALRLRGIADETVQFIVVYAGPGPIRKLMTGLHLNQCYIPEACELRDPFGVEDTW